MHESKPKIVVSADAEEWTDKMFEAINKKAWDSTRYVKWLFPGGHAYVWDKFENQVEVIWGNKRVLLHTKTVSGVSFIDGKSTNASKNKRLINKSWSMFCNDSWWLNAPSKARDKGVERTVVKTKEGRVGLQVQYKTGGVTPGDTYVWFLNEAGLPIAYKMWVKIIPIGGVEASWDQWKNTATGAKIAHSHKMMGFEMPIKNIETGQTLEAIDEDPKLFAPLNDYLSRLPE